MRAWSLEKADYLSESECLSHVLLVDWAEKLSRHGREPRGRKDILASRYAAHSAQDL